MSDTPTELTFDNIKVGDTIRVSYVKDDITRITEGTVARLTELAARSASGQVLTTKTYSWDKKDHTITLLNRPRLLIPTEPGSRGRVTTENSLYYAEAFLRQDPEVHSKAKNIFVIFNDGSNGLYNLDGSEPHGTDSITSWQSLDWAEEYDEVIR